MAACAAVAGQIQAQDANEPDLSFLEYLGSWQEDDEEWLIASEWEPGSDGEAVVEDEDEPKQEMDDDDE